MDYTLVRYKDEEFESVSYLNTIEKLIKLKKYPEKIRDLKFEYERIIQGILIDKKQGNLLKVSRFGKVRSGYHGLTPLSSKEIYRIYRGKVIDLNDKNIECLDTCFSIAHGVLFAQLVDLKNKGMTLPDNHVMANHIRDCVDWGHRDGSLKGHVLKDLNRFIIQEPSLPPLLESYKRHGKKLLIITNSDYQYTRKLLDFTINPFLKEHKSWRDLFEITITYSQKPRFFTNDNIFFKIDPKTGLMSNTEEKIEKGIFQGGCATKLEEDLGIEGDEILYVGDHIYGDVIGIKKTSSWRTALVLEHLAEEVDGARNSDVSQKKIHSLFIQKKEYEDKLNLLYNKAEKHPKKKNPETMPFGKIDEINKIISSEISRCRSFFNPYWGELMRTGTEESRFADQIEKYACIYMSKVSDLFSHHPQFYFRPSRKAMPHEEF